MRNTGGEINSSHLQHIPEQRHPIHVQKKTLITAARDSGEAAKLAKARGGEVLWFFRAGMDSTQTRLSKRIARLWCIIQKQVMYGHCVREGFNKRESCLSFGGNIVFFLFSFFLSILIYSWLYRQQTTSAAYCFIEICRPAGHAEAHASHMHTWRAVSADWGSRIWNVNKFKRKLLCVYL